MTEFEWIDMLVEIEDTMPDPADVPHRELRRQMWAVGSSKVREGGERGRKKIDTDTDTDPDPEGKP